MVINPLLARGLQDCIGGAWLQGIYSDFILEVEDASFKCHRFILAASSELFKCMLDSDMKESLQNSATIGDIDKHTMSTVLSALYTGVDGLNQDNIYEVWRAVHQLQISHMVKCCEDYVMKNISEENYFDVLQQAKLLKSDSVLEFVEKFMIENFKKISKTETFLELAPDELYNLLQNNELTVNSEDTALESLLTWCKHNSNSENVHRCLETGKEKTRGESSSVENGCTGEEEDDTRSQSNEILKTTDGNCLGLATGDDNAVKDMNQQIYNRSKHMKRLLSAVRLYLVSYDCLQKVLLHLISMSWPDACRLLIDAITYQMELKRRHFAWPLPAIHRASSDKEHVMVFWGKSYYNQSQLYAFRFLSNTTSSIYVSEPRNFDILQGLCVYDNTLFLSYYGNDSAVTGQRCNFTTMLTKDRAWETVSKEYSISSNCSDLLVHGQRVYRLQEANLYFFSPERGFPKSWTSFKIYLGGRNQRISSLARVTFFRDNLIIFDPDKSGISWISLKAQKMRTVPQVEGNAQDIVSFGNEEETYIIQGSGSLRKIVSPNAEELSFPFITQLWNGGWKLRGALLFRGRLFIFGKDLPQEANNQILVPSLAGVYESITVVDIDTDFPGWPMVIPKSW